MKKRGIHLNLTKHTMKYCKMQKHNSKRDERLRFIKQNL